jgi:uncharacterized protein (DUF2147 family)
MQIYAKVSGGIIMKKFFLLPCIIFLMLISKSYASEADAIIGEWYTDSGKSIVEIQKCDYSYCGKITWLKEPKYEDGTEKIDKENPEVSKRNTPIIGLTIIQDFKYKGSNKWSDGKIYDPENGKTYSCKMKLKGNKLKVRGYIGISLLGRTTVWEKKM